MDNVSAAFLEEIVQNPQKNVSIWKNLYKT